MPRTLVVFYSLSGNTEKVARAIAERLDADLEAIRETKARSGGWGYMTAAMGAIFGSMPQIEPSAKDPADYDIGIEWYSINNSCPAEFPTRRSRSPSWS